MSAGAAWRLGGRSMMKASPSADMARVRSKSGGTQFRRGRWNLMGETGRPRFLQDGLLRLQHTRKHHDVVKLRADYNAPGRVSRKSVQSVIVWHTTLGVGGPPCRVSMVHRVTFSGGGDYALKGALPTYMEESMRVWFLDDLYIEEFASYKTVHQHICSEFMNTTVLVVKSTQIAVVVLFQFSLLRR
nr:hypothetical protein CFP56_53265 [Quercus suber]